MAGFGLSIEPGELAGLRRSPRPVIAGIVAQILLVPAAAFGVAAATGLSGAVAAGLVLVAACPGGLMSNVVVHVTDGARSLSLLLTALSSVIVVVTLPFVVGLGLRTFAGRGVPVVVPLAETIGTLVALILVPVGIGMALRRHFADRAARWADATKPPSVAVIVAVLVAVLVAEREVVRAHLTTLGPAVVALNFAALAVGAAVGWFTRLERAHRVAVTVEAGIQNTPVALAVALTVLDEGELAVTPILYAPVQLATALVLAYTLRRWQRAAATPAFGS